jgi:hypothetical protein
MVAKKGFPPASHRSVAVMAVMVAMAMVVMVTVVAMVAMVATRMTCQESHLPLSAQKDPETPVDVEDETYETTTAEAILGMFHGE